MCKDPQTNMPGTTSLQHFPRAQPMLAYACRHSRASIQTIVKPFVFALHSKSESSIIILIMNRARRRDAHLLGAF